MNDWFWFLIWRGLDAEIVEFQSRLKTSVLSSIQACPDTTLAAKVAGDMIDLAFNRFRGVKARAR